MISIMVLERPSQCPYCLALTWRLVDDEAGLPPCCPTCFRAEDVVAVRVTSAASGMADKAYH